VEQLLLRIRLSLPGRGLETKERIYYDLQSVCYAIVFDNVGNIYDHPLAPGNSYNSSIVINYSSTLSTLRTAAQNDIIDAYGFTPTFIWLDDKGLL